MNASSVLVACEVLGYLEGCIHLAGEGTCSCVSVSLFSRVRVGSVESSLSHVCLLLRTSQKNRLLGFSLEAGRCFQQGRVGEGGASSARCRRAQYLSCWLHPHWKRNPARDVDENADARKMPECLSATDLLILFSGSVILKCCPRTTCVFRKQEQKQNFREGGWFFSRLVFE